jgi:hypothetical protein
LAAASIALLFVSCLGPKREAAPRADSARGRGSNSITVVVAVDGVRWQEVFGGTGAARASEHEVTGKTAAKLLPNLHRIMQHEGCAIGAPESGSPISASGPNFVSMPGYTEIFTGAAPVECHDNECQRVRVPTIADDAALLDRAPGRVAVITSWPKIALAASQAPGGLMISAGRETAHNEALLRDDAHLWRAYRRGAKEGPSPGWGGYRADLFTAEVALRYLEHFRPRFLFVGLGDTDEYAHHNDYKSYIEALQHADRTVGRIYESLRRAEQDGVETLLLVTSDHGRAEFVHHGADYPESARSWLVAAGSAISSRGLVTSPEPRRLADLAPTIRAVWGLSEPNRPLVASRRPGSVLTELFRTL